MEGILGILMQMYDYMQGADRSVQVIMPDGRVLLETVVTENNRAITRTGRSPLKV